jgi:SAM-dependent methyltransferase
MHDDFEARQREHFARADRDHFAWQTAGPGFAEREASLLAHAVGDVTGSLLEMGCGEGGNLFHLLASASPALRPVGIDAFPDKLHFASTAVPRARFVCADSGRLPFTDGSFDTVLIRDVLHHLPDPLPTLTEACRVLAPGGQFVLIEPNSRNPLVRLQMAIVPAERGAARSDEAWLRHLTRGLPLARLEVDMAAALPLARVLLHHKLGLPRLGRSRAVAALLDRLEGLAARLLPRSRWSYVLVRAERT